MKKKRKFKFKIIMTVLFAVLIIALGFCIKNIFEVLKTNENSGIEILDIIPKYGYSLNENDGKYFISEFKNLKKILEKNNIDEEQYAKSISKLFVIDFFSLSDVINKNDVGGVQFVYTDYHSDFIKSAKDSIYKYVENNIYGNRKQELPVVTKVNVGSIENDNIKYEKVSDKNAYIVNLEITYEKDLDYPTTVELIIIHNQNKLEIAEMK